MSDALTKLELELRRGVVVLATLSQLRAPRYGYELRQALAERGMPIEEGTLYPLLRRLEGQGLLDERMAHRRGAAPPLLRGERRRPQAVPEAGRLLAGLEPDDG